ncbi:DNA-directed RNA polymerase III subunit Rpc5 [Elsinoe ampelina]|uniref:DNA-directed RNA polymerase III subunit Rpc5 n=1 Tax=Elsinoe ampelina TaxID=302913 RepID=A0A6A6GN56_9PEZI|nr:DNA-directed RNA polymerase III subunit Rpc5 [Elsinoe ampelina]
MAPRNDPDKDPVVSEYDIFITPAVAEEIFMLQYPLRNAGRPYNRRNGGAPTEMRMKKESGFIEVDIEMEPEINFNKARGIEWGKAMQQAKVSGLTTFGASAGFGPGAIKSSGHRGSRYDEYSSEVNYFPTMMNNGKVFRKQTLGGQISSAEEGKPQYMLGTFRGKELHLTKVDGMAQMRPQFHHVDAEEHVKKASAARETDESRPAQARGFTQTYKSAKDDASSKSKSLMQVAQEEKWTRMNFFDEDDGESYEAYNTKMFVKDTDSVEKLHSNMSNEEYLDAISAPRNDPGGRRKKKPLTKKQREAIAVGNDITDPVDELPAE